MSELITITGLNEVVISSTAEARKQRDSLLATTATVLAVTTPEQAENAANVLKNVKALTRLVEAGRTAVKAPVLDKGKQIDALAKELTFHLDQESVRISRVLGVWQAEQARLAEIVRREAWEKEEQIRLDAADAERDRREKAEADQRELERKQAAAKTPEKAEEYRQEAEAKRLRADQEQDRADLKTEQAIVDTRVAAVAQAPLRPSGITARSEIKFEVTDAVALYEAAPYLVILTPNVTAIKQAIKTLTGDQRLPGVKHWREAVAVVNGR